MSPPISNLESLTDEPPNAATPLGLLDGRQLGPGSIFQRNNFAVPAAPSNQVRVHTGEREFSLDPGGLGRLPTVEVAMVLECAGNGRALMDPTPEGTPWGLGAVSPARFGGVRLLDAIGDPAATTEELVFTGSDNGVVEPEGTVDYQFSLTPDLWDRAILATHLNGDPLPLEHGGPIRLVVPGQYAMKSVKWLRSIEAVDGAFTGHFVSKYRYFGEAGEGEGAPVGDIRIRSVIASPADGAVLSAGRVEVFGTAWADGSGVALVEVSFGDDEGWRSTALVQPASRYGHAAWRAEATLDPGRYVIAARATDSSGATQPQEPRWNRNGYGNNVVHRVTVTVA